MRGLFPHIRNERGAVLVVVAIWLPVLIIFSSFAIDVANWFEHQRHLQVQVDAGALAGGGLYNGCLSDVLNGTTSGATAIITKAQQYDGDPTYGGGAGTQYNQQIGGGFARTQVAYNSKTYPVGGPGPDDTVTGSPCTAKMLDVKASEVNVPVFFSGIIPFSVVRSINARARVEIKPQTTGNHTLPVAFPDPNPTSGIITFINDNTGAELSGCTDNFGNTLSKCTVPIRKGTVANGLTWWDNITNSVSVPIGVPRIGVRVALAGGPTTLCGAGSAGTPACGSGVSAATTSATCAQVLVDCYELGTATSLVDIRGWATTPSGAQPNPPQLRDVSLLQGTNCADPYFSSSALPCSNVQIGAHVDMGGLANSSATITAFGGGCPKKGCPLSFVSGDFWRSGDIAITAAGATPFTLQWSEATGTVTGFGTCNTGGSNPCNGTFNPGGGSTSCTAKCTVQQTYIASDALTESVKAVQVWNYDNPGAPLQWANSFQSSATPNTHTLVVTVGVVQNLADAQSVSDPVQALRVIGGSQNQAVYCDPAVPQGQLDQMLANGCAPTFTENTGTACPNTANAVFNSPQPWQCVPIETGNKTNMIAKGLIQRIYGSTPPALCPALGQNGANNWSMFPNLPPGDPRIVEVFLTPFGSFSGSGQTTVPVEQFATFYITGWTTSGNGNQDPCVSEEDPAPGGQGGYIMGHFIKYIQTLNTNGGGPGFCDFSSFGACVVVLTN